MPDFPFKRAEAGQPLEIPARDYNALCDSAREFARYKRGRTDSAPLGAQRVDPQTPATYAIVKWESALALAEFAVVTYGTPVILPDDTPKAFEVSDMPVFIGTTPAATTDPIVILTEPVAQNAYGRAVTCGIAVVDVDVIDADHTHATATASNNTKLTSGMRGQAKILYKPSGTGTKRSIVFLEGPARSNDGLLMGKLDATLNYTSSATLSIWAWNGSADADTTENVTVYDWLLSSGQSIASGKQVVAAYVGGRWRVIGAQCS